MASTRTLEIRVNQSGNAAAGLSAITGAAGKLGMVAGGVALAGIAALGAGIVSSIGAAMEAQDGLAELNAVIESTGGIAGITAEKAQELASSFQNITRFSDDAILAGESMLLTFTRIGSDVFPDATEAMLNLAQKFGSMEQASVMLGKALNDPIQGVTALRRMGIQLSDTQEEQIKHFMEMNDIASAQRVILGELETQFGGLAVAAGSTAAGQMDIFWNKLGDVQEVIGGAFLPAIVLMSEKLSTALDSPQFQAALTAITGGIQEVINVITPLASGDTFLALVNFQGALLRIGFSPEQVGSISEAVTSIAADADRIGVAFSKMTGSMDVNTLELITRTLDGLAFVMERIATAAETAAQAVAIFQTLGGMGAGKELLNAAGGAQGTGLVQAGMGLAPAAQMAGAQGFQPVTGATGGAPLIDIPALVNALVSAIQSAPPPNVNVYNTLDSDAITSKIEKNIGQAIYGQQLIAGPGEL